ncbi:MAG: hypothetical protein SVP26_05115, partial [Chloroflexota bacterium]|nr:hypothetical protein [Chloroflexota bacterium]
MLREIINWIVGPRKGQPKVTPTLLETCLNCEADLTSSDLYRRYRVCPQCGFHYVLPAYERVSTLADEGSFIE